MMPRAVVLLLAFAWTVGGFASSSLIAQDQVPSAAQKQELARHRFAELTDRMQKLMVALQQSEPDGSRILAAGLQFAQEKKLLGRLDRAGGLLRQERWDEALVEMAALQKDLSSLLQLLQNRDADLQRLLEEIQRLSAFRERVEQLAREQGAAKEDSARTEALQRHLADLEAHQQKTAALLAAQQQLRRATRELGVGATAEATKSLAEQEAQLQQETGKLARDLEQLEQRAAELAEPQAGGCSSKAAAASRSMGQASRQLGERRTEASLADQDQAIDELRQTLAGLEAMAEQARRELLKLPFEEQAKRQEATQHATDTLAKDMEQSEKGVDGAGNKSTPGKQRVQQAVPKQRAAAGQLKEYVPAKQKQQDAKEDLESARRELDDALAQLRQQLQDEVLRALEERFTAMLARQRDLSVATRALDASRANVLTAAGALPAAMAERLAELSAGETELQGEAAEALRLLAEDATTAVFPPMVEQLRDDLGSVARRLQDRDSGPAVQAAQREIEELLELLVNALRRTIERKEAGQCGSCNGGAPPLVPISAELKILHFLQKRVNDDTKVLDGKPEAQRNGADGLNEAVALAKRQGRVEELMRRLAEKLGKENDTEGGR